MVRKPSYQELYDLAIFAQILQPHALSVNETLPQKEGL